MARFNDSTALMPGMRFSTKRGEMRDGGMPQNRVVYSRNMIS